VCDWVLDGAGRGEEFHAGFTLASGEVMAVHTFHSISGDGEHWRWMFLCKLEGRFPSMLTCTTVDVMIVYTFHVLAGTNLVVQRVVSHVTTVYTFHVLADTNLLVQRVGSHVTTVYTFHVLAGTNLVVQRVVSHVTTVHTFQMEDTTLSFSALFHTTSDEGKRLLRLLDANRVRWLECGEVRPNDWPAAIEYARRLCIFTVAAAQQPQARTRGARFRYTLRVMSNSRYCDCVLAPVVAFCIQLLLLTLRFSYEWERTATTTTATTRTDRRRMLRCVLGVASFVQGFVLDDAHGRWVDFNEEWLGVSKQRFTSLRTAVTAYSLWNEAQGLLLQAEKLQPATPLTAAGITPVVASRTSIADVASVVEHAKIVESAAKALYQCHVLLAQGVPESLHLGWTEVVEYKGALADTSNSSSSGTTSGVLMQHHCTSVEIADFKWAAVERALDVMRTALKRQGTESKPAYSWSERASLEWVVVLARQRLHRNQKGEALALYRYAVAQGRVLPEALALEDQRMRSVALQSVPQNIAALVQPISVAPMGLDAYGDSPLKWTDTATLSRIATTILPLGV
jgi:hypothetical protein